jgi:hypothetical protein
MPEVVGQCIKMVIFAEERGEVGGQGIDEFLPFAFVLL